MSFLTPPSNPGLARLFPALSSNTLIVLVFDCLTDWAIPLPRPPKKQQQQQQTNKKTTTKTHRKKGVGWGAVVGEEE